MPEIKIYRQKRRSLMMRAVPGAVEVYIPYQMNEDDKRVRDFIDKGLKKIGDTVPDVPAERTSREAVLAMVDFYAQQMNVKPQRVQLRDMRRKWGSCSSRGTITLNTRLSWLAPHLVQYVVCHELAHLIELNHSRKFWAVLAQYMPDYKTRLDELRRVEKTLW